MNQVDLLILAVVTASVLSGPRLGSIRAAGELVAVGLGLGIASVGYPLFAAVLLWLGLPKLLASLLGFLSLALAVAFLVGWVANLLAGNLRLSGRLNKLGGAALGGVMGVMLASLLILLSGMITRSAQPVERSQFGLPIIRLVPRPQESMERIGAPLPKLVKLPTDYREELSGARRGRQFLRLNATRLGGAVCFHCRTPVKFEGYQFVEGTLLSPRFRCPKCGRTSDGCQTFEGFHTIYGVCPTRLASEGVRFDCGVWTNSWWTVPHGKCPICGREYRGAAATARSPAGAHRRSL